jgi:hypothetical protein
MVAKYKDAVPVKLEDGTGYVLSYQVTDDAGKPIGAPSVFHGKDPGECYRKAMHSHQDSQKAIDRLRKSQTIYKPGSVTDAEGEAIKARQATAAAIESRESYEFMRSHIHDFNPCQANAAILRDLLEREGLAWTATNLEAVFTIALKEGKLAPMNSEYKGDTVAVVEEVPEPIAVPWTPNPLTREAIRDMSREDYKAYLYSKDPQIQAEFRKQLLDLGIRS